MSSRMELVKVGIDRDGWVDDGMIDDRWKSDELMEILMDDGMIDD